MISVCVPAYRRHQPPNLDSLAEELDAALAGEPGELVTVLNGLPSSAAPRGARVVRFELNRGVAPAWNAAARAACGDVLVFANDDIVLGSGALAKLARFVRDMPAAGVAGVSALKRGLPAASPVCVVTDGPFRALSCDAVQGHLFATRREVFEAAGGFDEQFAPCLWEEADFCFAVRARLGLQCLVVEGVDVEHHPRVSARRSWPWARIQHSGTSESLWAIRRRNHRRLRAKWAGSEQGVVHLPSQQ